jgi:hypothetical protein
MCLHAHIHDLQDNESVVYVVDPYFFTYYSANKAYLTGDYLFPADVNDLLEFKDYTNDNKHAAMKIMHWIKLKGQNNVINMKAMLVNLFLGLISNAIKLLYKQDGMMNPNASFCFDWFVEKYSCMLAEDREANRTAMATG